MGNAEQGQKNCEGCYFFDACENIITASKIALDSMHGLVRGMAELRSDIMYSDLETIRQEISQVGMLPAAYLRSDRDSNKLSEWLAESPEFSEIYLGTTNEVERLIDNVEFAKSVVQSKCEGPLPIDPQLASNCSSTSDLRFYPPSPL